MSRPSGLINALRGPRTVAADAAGRPADAGFHGRRVGPRSETMAATMLRTGTSDRGRDRRRGSVPRVRADTASERVQGWSGAAWTKERPRRGRARTRAWPLLARCDGARALARVRRGLRPSKCATAGCAWDAAGRFVRLAPGRGRTEPPLYSALPDPRRMLRPEVVARANDPAPTFPESSARLARRRTPGPGRRAPLCSALPTLAESSGPVRATAS
jgi:hypothetical protein